MSQPAVGQIPDSDTGITTASSQVFAGNGARVSVIISNTGNHDAFGAFDVAKGIGSWCG